MALEVNVIEVMLPGAREIVSLAWGRDGRLYGGTTGAKEYLFFRYDPATGETADLGGLVVSGTQLYDRKGDPVTQKIHKGLAVAPDGKIYGVTGQNVGMGIAHWRLTDDEGGHVFSYDPKTGECRDLGIPVPPEWIINCAIDPNGKNLFGMTYPLNHVFRCDLETGDMRVIDQLHGGTYGDSACSHECICDLKGNLYGSCSDGYLFKYDPVRDSLVETDIKLPGGDVRIDSLARHESGLIFGGTWESGHLFVFDPSAEELTDLGQPNVGPRLSSLAFGRDGRLYGTAGGGSQYGTRGAFLFSYDLDTGQVEEIGDIYCEEKGILGQRMHAMATGDDGTIYMGETGADVRHKEDPTTGGYIEAAPNPYLFMARVLS